MKNWTWILPYTDLRLLILFQEDDDWTVLWCCSLCNRKDIQPVKVLPQQCSWLTMIAWWQHAVMSSTVSLSLEGHSLQERRQGSPQNHHSVADLSWQHVVPSQEQCHASVLWCCWLGDRKRVTCKVCHSSSQQFTLRVTREKWAG